MMFMTRAQLESIRQARLELHDAGRRADFLDWCMKSEANQFDMKLTMQSDSLQRVVRMNLHIDLGRLIARHANDVATLYGASVAALHYQDGQPFQPG